MGELMEKRWNQSVGGELTLLYVGSNSLLSVCCFLFHSNYSPSTPALISGVLSDILYLLYFVWAVMSCDCHNISHLTQPLGSIALAFFSLFLSVVLVSAEFLPEYILGWMGLLKLPSHTSTSINCFLSTMKWKVRILPWQSSVKSQRCWLNGRWGVKIHMLVGWISCIVSVLFYFF